MHDEGSQLAEVMAQVMASGEPLVVPDMARDPSFAGHLDLRFEGLSFLAAAPLRGRDGVVMGVLAIHDTSARPFTDGDRKLLGEMADELCLSVVAEAELAVEGDLGSADAVSAADAAEPMPA